MEGIDSPCCEAVGDMRAPVPINNNSFISPVCSFGRKYPQRTLALHPQPDPPAWVSCSSGSNIMTPQS